MKFVSLNDNFDKTTIHRHLIFNIFASLAEIERELIIEITRASLETIRRKSLVSGRKPRLNNDSQSKAYMTHALAMIDKPIQKIFKILKLSKSTYYRYMEWLKEYPDKGKKRWVRSASRK